MHKACMCTNTANTGEKKKIFNYCNIHVVKRMKTFICKNLCLHVMISQGKSKECAGVGNIEQ